MEAKFTKGPWVVMTNGDIKTSDGDVIMPPGENANVSGIKGSGKTDSDSAAILPEINPQFKQVPT